MIRLRRKKRELSVPSEEQIREVMRQELEAHDNIAREKNDKERHKRELRHRIMNLPKNRRIQFLRYLEKRGKNEK